MKANQGYIERSPSLPVQNIMDYSQTIGRADIFPLPHSMWKSSFPQFKNEKVFGGRRWGGRWGVGSVTFKLRSGFKT